MQLNVCKRNAARLVPGLRNRESTEKPKMIEITALVIILIFGIPFAVCTMSLALYVVACILTLSLDEPPFRRQALGYAAGVVFLAFPIVWAARVIVAWWSA
jgi:hypothetical protein